MKITTIFFAMLIASAGCAIEQEHPSTSMADGSVVYALKCSDDWGSCHRQANKICGARGYTEVDRHSAQSVTNAGRVFDHQDDYSKTGVYKEDMRTEERDRVLTIRCDN